jgi:uncharacterized protein YecT (DUF1311 family)
MRYRLPATAVFAALSLVVASASASRADCAASKNDFEDVYCGAKNFITADGDLNAAYKALVAKLDGAGKAALKKSQVAWMKSRNDQCGKTDSDGYYVDLDCAVETTRNRTRFLNDRKSECDGGSCDLKRLAETE